MKLIAEPSDDFGIRRGHVLRRRDARPAATLAARTAPRSRCRRDAACGAPHAGRHRRGLARTDGAAAHHAHHGRVRARRRPRRTPPTVKLPDNLTTIPPLRHDRHGARRRPSARSRRVDFFLGARAGSAMTPPRPTSAASCRAPRRSARRPCAWSSPTRPALTGQDSRQVDRAEVHAARPPMSVTRQRLPRNRVPDARHRHRRCRRPASARSAVRRRPRGGRRRQGAPGDS